VTISGRPGRRGWSSRTGRRSPPAWSPGAHPKTTYLDLVGEEHLPPEVVRDIRRYRTRSGSVKVNLALGELPAPTAWDGPVPGDPHRGLIAISPSVEYLERAWDEAKYGGTSSEPYIEAVFPTVHEPELAPEGKYIALCFTQFGAYELRGRTWEEEREAYGKTVIRTLGSTSRTSRGSWRRWRCWPRRTSRSGSGWWAGTSSRAR
jgi:phytoene dehydrogenase-like protein